MNHSSLCTHQMSGQCLRRVVGFALTPALDHGNSAARPIDEVPRSTAGTHQSAKRTSDGTGVPSVTNPKWGTKRTCQSCGAKFYDLRRDPIVCPKCDDVFEPEAEPRPRKRSRAAKADAKPVAVKEVTETPETEATDEVPDLEDVVEYADDADEDEDLIEDTSDLGKDEDDVAEVMVGVVSEDKADI